MTYKLSPRSLIKLSTCAPKLVKLIMEAIKTSPFDFAVICGHRGEEQQTKAFDEGRSKVLYPMSEHNSVPSTAVDLAPYPIDWDDIEKFKILACHIKITAYLLDIPIEWGGDWKSFKDYPHYQLKT